jgi:predicted cupin superfamily sugar epimerase
MIIENIIKTLHLIPHPEGGFYSETYRSEITIPGMDRQLMTIIYFLLTSENVSHFHRIKSDEFWFFHSGSPLIVHILDENGHSEVKVGNDLFNGELPQFMVPKNTIFGSSVSEDNSYSLVSCAVAPGFDFNDFELFNSVDLVKLYPDEYEIISRLTSSEI